MPQNFKNSIKSLIFAQILIDYYLYAVYQVHANYYNPLGGINFFHSLAAGIGVYLEPNPIKGFFKKNSNNYFNNDINCAIALGAFVCPTFLSSINKILPILN